MTANTGTAGVIGVVIGGIGALLWSPKSGPEIRRMVGDQFQSFKNRAKEMMPKVQEQTRVS